MKNGILQKKKFIKKIVLAFLSIFIVGKSYTTRVHALSNVITYNNYGSFTRGNYDFTVVNTTVYSTSVVIGELNAVYNGSVRINLTGFSSHNFTIIPDNCHITNITSDYIDIAFENEDNFAVAFFGTKALTDSLNINSLTNWNMFKVSEGISSGINRLATRLDNISTYMQSIQNDTSSTVSQLQQINIWTSEIYKCVKNGGNLDNVLDSINSKLDLIANIKKISWETNNISLYGYGTDINNITRIENNAYYEIPNGQYLIFKFSSPQYFEGRLVNLSIPIRTNKNYEIYYCHQNDLTLRELPESYIYYKEESPYRLNLYIKIPETQLTRYILIKSNVTPFYYYNNEYKNYGSITSNDIDYFHLMEYFKMNRSLIENTNNTDRIINALNSLKITNEVQTEVNTNINNYNNVMTDINGVEINFKNEFNSSNQSIQTQNLKPSQNIQNSRIIFGGVFNQFLDEFAFLKTWLILLLICAIALILLGH